MSFETFWSITGNWLSNFCFQVACMLKTLAQICEIALHFLLLLIISSLFITDAISSWSAGSVLIIG